MDAEPLLTDSKDLSADVALLKSSSTDTSGSTALTLVDEILIDIVAPVRGPHFDREAVTSVEETIPT